MRSVSTTSATLLFLAAALPLASAADMPVRQVVLSSSGVGYFQHDGTVDGSTSVELSFKAGQINDVLKSLVLQDADGGRIGAVVYPSQDPLARTLKSFQVDLTGTPSFADLLQQLKGAAVTLKAGGTTIAGTIVGTELRSIGTAGDAIAAPVLTVVSGGTFRQVRLDELTDLTLVDEKLQAELTKALTAVARSRDQERKPVSLRFEGEGHRRVSVGYVTETPLWKVSYRLLLPDLKATGAAKTTGALQAWAIVENQTDSDWTDVSLSLVSGRPIAFVQDLYQPLYLPRPVVQEERFASLAPQTYGGGMRRTGEDKAEAEANESAMPTAMAIGGMADAMPAPAAAPMWKGREEARQFAKSALAMETSNGPARGPAIDPTAGVKSMAESERLGVTFRYTVPAVTLPRQQSAMLPIISDPITVERVSIYNETVLARNPLQGALVTNTTKAHLLNGPVTVLDGPGYAGDARLDLLPPGEKRLLSFAVDTPVTVDPKIESTTNRITTARISQGVLRLTRALEQVKTYAIQNGDDHERLLVVEHPRQDGWALKDTPEPFETTERFLRFKVPVSAGSATAKPTSFTIRQTRTEESAFALVDWDADNLLVYARDGEVPKRVQDALRRAAELKQAQVEADRGMQRKAQELAQIEREQNRLRENLKTVQQNSEYGQRLLKKLNEQETQVEKLQGERDTFAATAEAKRKELADYLNGLKLE